LDINSEELLDHFVQRNEQDQPILLYYLADRGFFAEVTFLARVMLYAVDFNYRLVIDSSDFLHSYNRGWEDYFLPFCETYDPVVHRNIAKVARFGDARIPQSERGEALVNAVGILSHFSPRLNIGPYEIYRQVNILREFTRAIFRLQPDVAQRIEQMERSINLPEHYAAAHIRRGDKVGDEDIFYACEEYMEKLDSMDSVDTLFIMSDDYRAVEEVCGWLADNGASTKPLTLCRPDHAGFDIWKLRAGEHFFSHREGSVQALTFHDFMYLETVQLLAEVGIASRATQFVSSQRSNVFRMVQMLHSDESACVGLAG
jgi:hypothetical protein